MEKELTKGFSIDARTCTLRYNAQKGGTTILEEQSKFIIPIYQRPYSWSDEQIKKFLSDIFLSFWGIDGKSEEEPMFIGTMQLSDRNEQNEYQVIDGQQRLTTFLILIKVLSIRFSACKELQAFPLNWLETKVNNGSQQKNFNELLAAESFTANGAEQNTYIANAVVISNILEDLITDGEDETEHEAAFDIEKFTQFILGKIYFVVIETRASLSKTLQIFNAINTTGLDLNGGDIFKLRMYEYLRDKKGFQDERDRPFEGISELFETIDRKNKEQGWVTDIHGILRIYKHILVAKYDLPRSLHLYDTNRFFDELFDTLSNTNRWDNFKNLESKGLSLSLEELTQIIETKYQWHSLCYTLVTDEYGNKQHQENFPTAEDACSWHFIGWSRYSRYHILAHIFAFSFSKEADFSEKLFLFKRQLSKLFIIYSIRYQKLKNEIYYSFMNEVMDALVHKTSGEVIAIINSKIGKLEDHKHGWYDLENILKGNLTYNAKLKNIACRLSAMLAEDYKNKDNNISKSIFHNRIDIEHIQAYKDSNNEIREEIWNEWGDDIHSLGNLVVLEYDINRSISNDPYQTKKHGYYKSSYKSIKSLVENYEKWDLDSCRIRKQTEVDKIITYLFN